MPDATDIAHLLRRTEFVARKSRIDELTPLPLSVAVDSVMADAHRAVIIARESLTAGGETREVERVLIYRVEGEQLAECWVYDEDQRFIDRALT